MGRSRIRAAGRSVLATLMMAAVLAAVAVGATQSPASAAVTSVRGEACAYMVNVGLFGGPQTTNGCGEGTDGTNTGAPRQPTGGTNLNASDTSYSPHVRISGSGGTMSATDDGGAKGVYGPAVIHGGLWPCEEPGTDPDGDGYPGNCPATAPSSGPSDAATTGSAASGTVTA